MKKKGIIIGIIIILVVLIMAGIIMVVSRNLGQEAALRVEMQEIYEMLGDTQVFEEEKVNELSSRLEKTVTAGDYAVVEQTIKQYLKECVDYTAGIMDIINSGKIEQLVTANNYESDGPDFVESTKYISETRAKLEEAKTKFTDMLSEEKVKSYIEGKVDNQHYIDLYNKLALGTGEENTLKEDLMRLYSTQAFKDVNRSIERCADNPNLYDVTIILEEQRTGTISLGGGVDTATGLFGQAGFVENNFLGNGQRVGINFMAGTGVIMSDSSTIDHANLQAEVSFFEPRLRGTDNALLVKAFVRDFGSYQVPLAIEQRYGAEVVLSRPFKTYKNLMGSIKLGGEYIKVKEGDFNKISQLYEQHNIPISERSKQLQGGTYITLGPSLVYDTRDNVLNPRSGVLATLRFNENINITDLDFTHGTLSAGIKRYFPVMKKSSFSLMARAAGKIHGDMPEVMAYSLGGPYTVRGYRMSTIGTGEGFMMASAELTTPFFFLDRIEKAKFLDNIKFSVFIDTGQLFNGSITNQLYNRPEYGIAGGVGIKLFIPGVGPLSIDYGIPFTNVGEGNRRGAFSFGVGDIF